jgi:hypothetical protein
MSTTYDAVRELDALVAEKVFGWQRCEAQLHPTDNRMIRGVGYCPPNWGTGERDVDVVPDYSTDIAAAWQVVEKMRGVIVSINPPNDAHDDEWCVEWFDGVHTLDAACAATAPLAICRAALNATDTPETKA